MKNLKNYRRHQEKKAKKRKAFLKLHGIEPCNKSNCKLCKPHKVWKKYSKFFNKQKLMEEQINKEVELESGTKYTIMNYEEDDK